MQDSEQIGREKSSKTFKTHRAQLDFLDTASASAKLQSHASQAFAGPGEQLARSTHA
jgi:hypothetical protein